MIQLGSRSVPCGKCNFCLSNRRADWSFRLSQEHKSAKSAHFLTLTYSDINLPWGFEAPSLFKRDLQLFHKRLTKASGSIRYYAVGEYGSITKRPHYHSIVFNAVDSAIQDVQNIWGLGNVHRGDVTDASIGYVTKYVIDSRDRVPGKAPPFSLMSRRPGLGNNYIQTHRNWHRSGFIDYTQVNGKIRRLPRYYRDRFFDEDERAAMADYRINQMSEKMQDEIDRLSKYHDDPYHYHQEIITQSYSNVKSKNKIPLL